MKVRELQEKLSRCWEEAEVFIDGAEITHVNEIHFKGQTRTYVDINSNNEDDDEQAV